MTDFITIIHNVLEEQGKLVDELFKENIISKNTFYKYRHRYPSLQTLIKVANYLKVSIDYIFEISDENNFIPYSTNQKGFYEKLINLINHSGISIRQFCKDLNYAKDNVLRYKKGVEPSIRTLLEISQYFNCSVDDLLSRGNTELNNWTKYSIHILWNFNYKVN